MSELAVTLRRVRVSYGSRVALRGVDLEVRAGERVALVGPSGAGKSTLLALCTGAVRPAEGEVTVLGRDLARVGARELADVRGRIGTIHQRLHLVERLRVVHNVNAGHLARWSTWQALTSLVRPREVATARAALARTGIEELLHARTGDLSGGEQQRVALARVLVQDPSLVLADEPVASLDPARAEEVMRLLCETVATPARTLLVSLHDFDLAVRWCDRVVGLREGQVVFDLPAAAVGPERRRELYALGRG
ncbi:phosphonate ABC transporter ATP-binding protein [Nocardioides campestrisoli]|uniref:phosphonate ABC transporter ATP-binding protein n=1 Tax=Nocardioides campestrisoli TaxID=2736757 RepID=UPI0015E79AD8|nr:ATP-binding cassette domain-containing protein [Nocardioides campestrisoli]